MQICYLIRRYFSDYTQGLFILPDLTTFKTLEEPDKDNQENISCIPEADYYVTRRYRPDHASLAKRDCYAVLDVPNREGILIHSGNTLRDTAGCILPGLNFSHATVTSSIPAMGMLKKACPEKFILKIRSVKDD